MGLIFPHVLYRTELNCTARWKHGFVRPPVQHVGPPKHPHIFGNTSNCLVVCNTVAIKFNLSRRILVWMYVCLHEHLSASLLNAYVTAESFAPLIWLYFRGYHSLSEWNLTCRPQISSADWELSRREVFQCVNGLVFLLHSCKR